MSESGSVVLTCRFQKANGIKVSTRVIVSVMPDNKYWKLVFNYNKTFLDELKLSMEDYNWNPTGKFWTVKICRRNAFVFDYWTDGEILEIYDKPIGKHSELLKGLEDFGGPKFWTHQVRMFDNIMTYKHHVIAGEMRTGKTPATLAAYEYSDASLCLWVTPKNARRSIKNAQEKWGFKKKVLILTYAAFRNLDTENQAPLFIVFDEAQKLKNRKSLQSRKAMFISDEQERMYPRNVSQFASYFVLLSGTPAPKSPDDWWHLAELVCPGFIRETFFNFQQRVGEYTQKEGQLGVLFWQLVDYKEDEVAKIYDKLKGLVSVYLKKECLDLPDIIYEVCQLEPSGRTKAIAAHILRNESRGAQALTILREISDGFKYVEGAYDEEKDVYAREVVTFETPKDARLIDHLDEYSDVGRLVVYAGFRASVDRVVTICLAQGWDVLRIDGRGVQSLSEVYSSDLMLDEIDGSLNTGKIEKLVVVAQPESASEGQEFSSAPASIYFSNSFNGNSRMQSEHRGHSNNMDKERGHTIYDYIHLASDQLTLDNLNQKKRLQSVTMGELNEIIG